MVLKETPIAVLAGVVAAILQALGFLLMVLAIRRDSASPNQCSWLIWSVVAVLAAASSWRAGATWPLAGAAMNALGCMAILAMSLRCGSFAVAGTDLPCLGVAALGLAAWLLTDDPVLGLLLFLGADACGAVPTIRHVLVDPTREDVGGWALLALAGAAAVLSVEPQQWAWSWSGFVHWGGAVYVALVNLGVTTSIVLVHLARLELGPLPDSSEAPD